MKAINQYTSVELVSGVQSAKSLAEAQPFYGELVRRFNKRKDNNSLGRAYKNLTKNLGTADACMLALDPKFAVVDMTSAPKPITYASKPLATEVYPFLTAEGGVSLALVKSNAPASVKAQAEQDARARAGK